MSIETADNFLALMRYGRELGLSGQDWEAVEYQYIYAIDIGIKPDLALANAKDLAEQISMPMFLRRQAI